MKIKEKKKKLKTFEFKSIWLIFSVFIFGCGGDIFLIQVIGVFKVSQ